MPIRWAERARTDVRDLRSYIAQDSPYYARQFVARILRAVDKLVDHPKIGRLVPEAEREDVRELLVQPYRIIYVVQSTTIHIVTVAHGARDLARMQLAPWEG
ncbi:type II toxin-antitoxin system RelE/ParE family toxin [Immundisolibacter sp.]|uniref:type II toxin-antitoxin system RelE/ParE family toxin n=1 Tax=Immundisolibacter sp. TaxID=1934948 RepID=UPI003564CBCE